MRGVKISCLEDCIAVFYDDNDDDEAIPERMWSVAIGRGRCPCTIPM